MSDKGLSASKEDSFSEWYTEVIQKSEMMDYSKVSGCMVMRPYSYSVWEGIQKFLDDEIKSRGVQNAYFPLFIPESLLEKEADHVEGFSPEVAWVTHSGDSELDERLAIRPTSETIMYDSYQKWIRSHNDLPLKLNQWCNVVRWEFKHPTPFLRTREFLWQEGHTCHASEESADEEVEDIIDLYKETFESLLAVPMLKGRKSEKEKFAGANYTLSVETMLPNGKAIQGATSHGLGQNFSESFDISFQDKDGENKFVWQNSWGFTTRSIGIMIMMHGDDRGLVMPPRIAPTQVVIVPILFSDSPAQNERVLEVCRQVEDELESVRVELDDREGYTPGWKFNHWELKGVPLRIEIGPRDIEDDQVMFVRRDSGDKESVDVSKVEGRVQKVLEDIQEGLFERAEAMVEDMTVEVDSFESLKEAVSDGCMAVASWCGRERCEDFIKDETGGGKSLNILIGEKPSGSCVYCDREAECVARFAKSY